METSRSRSLDATLMQYPKFFRLFLLASVVGGFQLHAQESTDRPLTSSAPLEQAHAHNDYEHDRPLLDALESGFCSVEADIYLVDGALLVAHDRDKVDASRTLQKLYLDPLQLLVATSATQSVYPGKDSPAFHLLIDLKSDAEPTYQALHSVLSSYDNLFSEYHKDGKVTQRAVTVIISGNRPKQVMLQQPLRFAGYDGRLSDLGKGDTPALMPWISDNFRNHFEWRGTGKMPEEEQQKLSDLVKRSHAEGKKLRLWATPDVPAMWEALRLAGVDMINSDRLKELSAHLQKTKEKAAE
ncbi:MAG: hypothetical protein ACI9R3_003502 [Verrucomicrobiales bacterium]|jgi:hypothetical protein